MLARLRWDFLAARQRDLRHLQGAQRDGTTILLVEQNANMALSIADRAYVLETGYIRKEGSAKELLSDEDVKKAYLGG
jgi:branched-chain amino acid transport system ATP-binding protein